MLNKESFNSENKKQVEEYFFANVFISFRKDKYLPYLKSQNKQKEENVLTC